jgi:hypothetical protein
MKNVALLVLALTLLPGCTRYFHVRDPGSGREYYTTKIGRTRTGAVRFRELQQRAEITLQSSEVKQVRREEMPPELLADR